ncbi:MAG: UDP-N-acetylmuramate dehydrogenase [Provencibacterium sp.]|nr:UDP-N-acetylmuramate dehydrogenase [Provencibacterium sp.]
MTQLIKRCEEIGCLYREQEPMRLHTSFKIGGPADLYLLPDRAEQIAALLPFAIERELPVHLLGRGSNVLVSDAGIRGVVLAVTDRLSEIALTSSGTVSCAAGASLEKLCRFALDHRLSGLEFAFGIPGSVGGAVFMNAGAYGGEVKDVLLSASHVTPEGQFGSLAGEALALSYRHSAYAENGSCILSAEFALQPGDPAAIRTRMEELKAKRREKQPLEYPSAGSTFKRPEGAYASALIDQCGLKGLRVGDAMVSEKHAGFIINAGSASCADVCRLIEKVKETVWERTGFQLECEIRLLS